MSDLSFLVTHFGLTLVLVACCSWLVVREYRAENPAVLFWIMVLGLYAIPSFFDPYRAPLSTEGSSRTFALANNPVLLKAHLFALGFTCVYMLVRSTTYASETNRARANPFADLPRRLRDSASGASVVRLLAFLALVSYLAGFYAIYSTLGWAGVTNSGYSLYRLESDPAFVRLMIYINATISGAVFIAWSRRNWLALSVIIVSSAGAFFLTFSRQLVVFLLMPFVLYLLYRERTVFKRVRLMALGVVAYYAAVVLQILRSFGSFKLVLQGVAAGQLLPLFWTYVSKYGGEADLRYVYYFFMGDDWNRTGVLPGQTYLRLLMLPIPSGLSFDTKPGILDAPLFYAFYDDNVYMNVPGGELHTLFFGDAWVSFGWWGVLLGVFWAIIAFGAGRLLQSSAPELRALMVAPMGFAAVLLARGSVYNSSAYVFWTIILIHVFYAAALLPRFVGLGAMPGRPLPLRRGSG